MNDAALDISRLENVKPKGAKIVAACPACREAGVDKSGEHLVIDAQGRFGCVANPGDAGHAHRCRIFELVGAKSDSPAPRATVRTSKTVRTWHDVQSAAKACTPEGFALVAVYNYPRDGRPFGAVARYESETGKTFRQFSMNGTGWKAGAPSGAWPLYNVESMPAAGPVWIVEGEKAQAAAVSIGLPTVTSAGGSKASAKTDWTPLQGRDAVILPDNDTPGTQYAEAVKSALVVLQCRVRVVMLPGLPEGGDIADFVGMRSGRAPESIRTEIERLAAAAIVTEPPEADGPEAANPVDAARAGTPYAMTDLGNAERLVALHGDSIRWDVARKVWRAWDGRRWDVDTALRVNTLAAETARTIRQEAAAAPSGNGDGRDLGQDLFKHAVKSEGRDRLNAMIEVAKARPGVAIAADTMDADPWKLNVLNGTLDLRTGTLRPHDRADLLTKFAPVEYRAGHRCDRWERFLADSTGGDAALVAFLQIVAGYTLTGDTSEEKLFLVYGPEAAGKSTFLDALRAVLGDYARTIQADLLTRQRESRGGGAASPELAGLAGARLAAGSEMEQGREIAEALAKNLTGGEPITARHLYAELFDFRPQFKLWLALNHCPKVSADDGAIWRRILRIGFEHTVAPERRDKTLKPYLRDPDGGAPAVLAWAVEGCLRWQSEGLRIPDAVARSTAAYRNESDPLAAFMEDCLQFEPMAWTAACDILKAYHDHCDESGIGERFRVSPKRLSEKLKAHDCTPDRRMTGRGWRGVELKTGDGTEAHDAYDAYDASPKTLSSKSFVKNSYGNGVISDASDMQAHPEPPELPLSDFEEGTL